MEVTLKNHPGFATFILHLKLRRPVYYQHYFGFSSLHSYQKEFIQRLLQGRYRLVVMATGAGKSLCYQLPPLITKKTCIVISPLLSLMQDQVPSM
ncbi:hypothetical protein HU200_001265 [Digitaria exilis]|uniref:Helicase ATP-binding domain-containing protein n=1 Tax=Digitaria exilis TaxID=1010633 RepID=A0A835G1C1_9POAL|nr:hypothetical protein HU200_001265 [Digitaria exilis]